MNNIELERREHFFRQYPAIVSYPLLPVETILLDVDKTLYPRNLKFEAHRREVQNSILAEMIDLTLEQTELLIHDTREQISEERDYLGIASYTEAVISLGIDRERWDILRAARIQPEQFLQPNPQLVSQLTRIRRKFNLILSSNSPSPIVHKTLRALGFSEDDIISYPLLSPDLTGVAKPNPYFYENIEWMYGFNLFNCLSVGDNLVNDGELPARLGMGAVLVDGPSQIRSAIEQIIEATFLPRPFNFQEFVQELPPIQGDNLVIGVTARAGSGKTTFAHELATSYFGLSKQPDVYIIHLDRFFILSSEERRQWLTEEGISDEERHFRRNQARWWDYNRMIEAIGNVLKEPSSYREFEDYIVALRQNRNSLENSKVFIIEGVPLPIIYRYLLFDKILYLYVHPFIRQQRLFERDRSKRTYSQLEDRFRITERFEHRLFRGGFARRVYPKLVVIDNTDANEKSYLPNHIPLV